MRSHEESVLKAIAAYEKLRKLKPRAEVKKWTDAVEDDWVDDV